jgi:hypothetical protein
VAIVPAAAIAAAAAILLTWPRRRACRWHATGSWQQRESLLPGWTAGRLWALSLGLCLLIAACDAASGPHLILIGLLICGPCCALLTARWRPTAATSCVALALGTILGIPDQVFATFIQYAFLAAVAVTAATATAGAAVLQHRRAPSLSNSLETQE